MRLSPVALSASGLRLVAREPAAALAWSGVALAIAVASLFAKTVLAGPDFAALTQDDGSQSFGEALAAFARWQGLSLTFSILGLAVLCCAVIRAVLRPEARRFAYLRLGGDEVRMAGAFVLMLLIFIAAILPVAIAAAVVTSVLVVAAGGDYNPLLSGAVLVVVMAPFAVWLGARLWLVGPMTFINRRIEIAGAWRASRGHVRALMGAVTMTWLILGAVMLAALVLRTLVASAVGGSSFVDGFGRLLRPETQDLSTVFSPERVAALVVGSILSGLYYAVMTAPAATAYRDLQAGKDVAETFA